jgi:hypothetical protein
LSSSKKVSLFAIPIGLKNGTNKIERDLFENRQKRMGFGIIALDSIMNFSSVRFQIVLSLNRQCLTLSYFVPKSVVTHEFSTGAEGNSHTMRHFINGG